MKTQSLEQFFEYSWINGELINSCDAKIHILTHSLHYAGAVYEGERAYSGKIFKLEEHVKRLLESANIMHIGIKYNFNDIIEAHQVLLKKNNIINAYIRPLIWRGSESLNIYNSILSTNLLIAAVASKPCFDQNLSGHKLHVSNWQKPSPNSMPPQVKSSGHYNMMIVAKIEAKKLGFDDAIILDHRGYIAECTSTNIFFVKHNKLITPIADVFLNGITRQSVIEMAHKLGLQVQEKHVTIDDITKYEECFVTGTAAEVQLIDSITLIDQRIIFKKTEISKLLQTEYQRLVRE
jgi:branched-chain amino acid aminotransferase